MAHVNPEVAAVLKMRIRNQENLAFIAKSLHLFMLYAFSILLSELNEGEY